MPRPPVSPPCSRPRLPCRSRLCPAAERAAARRGSRHQAAGTTIWKWDVPAVISDAAAPGTAVPFTSTP